MDARFPDLEGIRDILIAERAAAARLNQPPRQVEYLFRSRRPQYGRSLHVALYEPGRRLANF